MLNNEELIIELLQDNTHLTKALIEIHKKMQYIYDHSVGGTDVKFLKANFNKIVKIIDIIDNVLPLYKVCDD